MFVGHRSLAAGSMTLPSREYKWTNMKGLKYNLTTNQAYVRNYVFSQARKMVMKQTNGLYPAPLKILQVHHDLCIAMMIATHVENMYVYR